MFGTVKLTKNTDPYKYEYSCYDIGFDARSQFSLPGGTWSKNVIIFGVDNSSFVHVDNKKKNILAHGEGSTQGLEDAKEAEAKYFINFTESRKDLC